MPVSLRRFLEIHNPKVGSSSLPRAIAHCPAQAGLFAVWDWGFGDSTAGTNALYKEFQRKGLQGITPELLEMAMKLKAAGLG